MAKLKVGLLMGGLTDEYYLSLRSAKRIFDNFDREKYDFICYNWKRDGEWIEYEPNSFDVQVKTYENMLAALYNLKVDLLFISLHGDKEGDGRLAGLLDLLNIPYTGNGFYTSFVGMNKSISKGLFQQLGVHVPKDILLTVDACGDLSGHLEQIEQTIGFPCVVKPVCSGSSIGLDLVRDRKQLEEMLEQLMPQHDSILIEEYVKGKEYSVGIYGSYKKKAVNVLPVAEIRYPGELFDCQCKYDDTYQVVVPVEIPEAARQELIDIATRIHLGFRFEGFSRTDAIERDGQIHVLEVNTHPGLGGHSIFPAMINAAGIPFSNIIDELINWGLDRHR